MAFLEALRAARAADIVTPHTNIEANARRLAEVFPEAVEIKVARHEGRFAEVCIAFRNAPDHPTVTCLFLDDYELEGAMRCDVYHAKDADVDRVLDDSSDYEPAARFIDPTADQIRALMAKEPHEALLRPWPERAAKTVGGGLIIGLVVCLYVVPALAKLGARKVRALFVDAETETDVKH